MFDNIYFVELGILKQKLLTIKAQSEYDESPQRIDQIRKIVIWLFSVPEIALGVISTITLAYLKPSEKGGLRGLMDSLHPYIMECMRTVDNEATVTIEATPSLGRIPGILSPDHALVVALSRLALTVLVSLVAYIRKSQRSSNSLWMVLQKKKDS